MPKSCEAGVEAGDRNVLTVLELVANPKDVVAIHSGVPRKATDATVPREERPTPTFRDRECKCVGSR